MSFAMTGRPGGAVRVARQATMARRLRRPTHNAFLHFRPWTITPFLAAPVLPGETLKSALFQSRVLSSPIKNQVVGWWLEHYFFYVKHRHLINGDKYLAMMLDLNYTNTGTYASDAAVYHALSGDLAIVREAYNRVVNEFFRGDGESVGEGATALHKARVRLPGWWDSIIPTTALDTGTGGVGDDSIGGAALDQVGELGRALEQWQTLRMLGVTNLEYDDWLRGFGVSVAAPVEDRPELLRYTREWQLPSSAVSVDATAQRVSSVVSWSPTERIDKDRYFKEPGLILGVVLARPKMYHSRRQSGIGQLANALGWQTPFRTGGPYETYQNVLGLTGYAFDPSDLYNHGDQWVYVSAGTANLPEIAFPADGALDYASDAEINAIFVDGATGHLKMDGVVNLNIATGAVESDMTPRTV